MSHPVVDGKCCHLQIHVRTLYGRKLVQVQSCSVLTEAVFGYLAMKMNDKYSEKWINMKLLFKLGKNPTKTFEIIQQVYGEEVM
jgi:hypothetical protein